MAADRTTPDTRKIPAMNNPFKPVPQRPHRHDPERDRRRDPVFYAAFGDDEARK